MYEISKNLFFAESDSEVRAAWSFVHDRYVEQGIITPQKDGLFMHPESGIASTIVIVQKNAKDEICATCTLYVKGHKPCFSMFPEETIGLVHNSPDAENSVIEICQLAGTSVKYVLNLFRVIHRIGQIMCKDILAIVHPDHAGFYQKQFGFFKVAESDGVALYGSKPDVPGQLLWLPHRNYAAYQKMMLKWDRKPLGINVLDIRHHGLRVFKWAEAQWFTRTNGR